MLSDRCKRQVLGLAFFFALSLIGFSGPIARADDENKSAEDIQHELPIVQNQSKFALGLGLGWLFDYPGADQGRVRFLPFPVYRGTSFRVDRLDGVSGRVYRDTSWRLAWSFIFQFPTESGEIPIRNGMANLDWLLSLGPMVERTIWTDQKNRLFFRFPVRWNTCTNFSARTRFCGLTINPGIRYSQFLGRFGELTYRFEGFTFSKEYHKYFYEVLPSEATAFRPAYSPSAGWLGFVWGVIYQIPFEGWEFTGVVNYYDYGLAENRASPLFRTPTNYSIFLAVTVDL